MIGNSDYQDGKDLAAVLSQLYFKVIHKNNLNLREMKQAINQFGNKLRKLGGVLLFSWQCFMMILIG
ncbi:caspase family protein [Candidatus Marithrix sp. Canyon 246]|uniref:caspase family protein n=1 Tax=Candidatus Marithrix sp. Canyon 246 TaxID=1827136 RepID=UPI000849FB0F|nr:caspase family protein [Candidatus Marithrix sp. Canyon 246]